VSDPDYFTRYTNLIMERTEEGILHLRFHTNGAAFVWAEPPHRELEHAFREIGRDHANKVILMTGTGEDFCGRIDFASWNLSHSGGTTGGGEMASAEWRGKISWEGRQFLLALLDIEAPIIAAVHGRCTLHAEIPLLSDIVLASETAIFGDDVHFTNNVVPGDGIQILWTTLLGANRGRYLALTHELLDAHEAKAAGLVGEVLPPDRLEERAWELARLLAGKGQQVLRNTRLAVIRPLRRAYDDGLVHGFGLQQSAR
jgi:enoyl-CoA hydratase/carnithine racemase